MSKCLISSIALTSLCPPYASTQQDFTVYLDLFNSQVDCGRHTQMEMRLWLHLDHLSQNKTLNRTVCCVSHFAVFYVHLEQQQQRQVPAQTSAPPSAMQIFRHPVADVFL